MPEIRTNSIFSRTAQEWLASDTCQTLTIDRPDLHAVLSKFSDGGLTYLLSIDCRNGIPFTGSSPEYVGIWCHKDEILYDGPLWLADSKDELERIREAGGHVLLDELKTDAWYEILSMLKPELDALSPESFTEGYYAEKARKLAAGDAWAEAAMLFIQDKPCLSPPDGHDLSLEWGEDGLERYLHNRKNYAQQIARDYVQEYKTGTLYHILHVRMVNQAYCSFAADPDGMVVRAARIFHTLRKAKNPDSLQPFTIAFRNNDRTSFLQAYPEHIRVLCRDHDCLFSVQVPGCTATMFPSGSVKEIHGKDGTVLYRCTD